MSAMPEPPALPGFASSGDVIFDVALRRTLRHEGLWSDDPADPGGATMYGISLRFARGVDPKEFDFDIDDDGDIDREDIRSLSPEIVTAAYKRLWWDRHRYGDFVLPVSAKLFDMAVNMGAAQAHKLVQRAARACGAPLTEDGVLGPRSRAAITGLPPEIYIAALRSETAGFYRALVAAKPKFAKFLGGWLNRAYA